MNLLNKLKFPCRTSAPLACIVDWNFWVLVASDLGSVVPGALALAIAMVHIALKFVMHNWFFMVSTFELAEFAIILNSKLPAMTQTHRFFNCPCAIKSDRFNA